MEFIQDLIEARMTRDKSGQRLLSYRDCCERAYLTLLILELMRNYPQLIPNVKGYANKTCQYNDYRYFRATATDLYNFIYFIIGDDDALEKLKDPDAAKKVRVNTSFPRMAVNRYLSNLKNNLRPLQVPAMFVKLEADLNIVNSDYKAVRRAVVNWDRLSNQEKQNVTTRLLFAARAKLRSSDIIDDFEKAASIKNLETSRIKDNEPTVSMPDIQVQGKDLAYYRYLVGLDNVMLAKKFIEYASNGQAVPSNFVKAYLPIIQMIDDIVKDGPTSINLLRSIHKRAQKRR